MRLQIVVVAIIAGTGITGCGGAGHVRPVPLPHRPVAPQGMLTGVIVLGGGPAGLAGRALEPGDVTVFTMTGRLIAHRRVARGQPFAFQLAPGRYQINSGRILRPIGGCRPKTILVRPARSTHTRVEINCAFD